MQCLAKLASTFLRKPILSSPNTLIVSPLEKAGGIFDQFTRNVIRNHFPRPSEAKRIRRHGYKKRLSTPSGRRILMNRILKGRWVISH